MGDRRVLLIGAGGIVGTEVRRLLDQDKAVDLSGVGRSSRRGIVGWDIVEEPPPPVLDGRWDAIILNAALTSWNLTEATAWRNNVDSIVKMSSLLDRADHVVYVSTLYTVAKESTGQFRNTYESSKAAAECIVRQRSGVTIVRPPLVFGRSDNGEVARYGGAFSLLYAISTGILPVVVYHPQARVELAPVDQVAQTVVDAATGPTPSATRELNIGAGEAALRSEEMVETMLGTLDKWRCDRGHEPMRRPDVASPEQWNRLYKPFFLSACSPRQRRVVEALDQFVPYFQPFELPPVDVQVAQPSEIIRLSVETWAERNQGRATRSPNRRFWKESVR